jgi:beta-galactosidase
VKNRFLHGAVLKLTREDTLSDIARNLAQMKEAGLDTVVIWPAFFWWEEKSEDYPFRTGKEILRLAAEQGMGVVMELAGQLPQMEYIPDFMMKDAYYCTDEHGHRRVKHNSFGYLNYFHPEVDALIRRHFADAARAYSGSPALVAYDIFNETAFNSYDPYTLEEFRGWLKGKYKSLSHLNDVWERCYTDWTQVSFTPWMWMSVMPAADFTAFRKEAVGIILRRWGAAIRTVDSRTPLWADNVGSMIRNGAGVLERPQDDFVLQDAVDEIGMSFYPKQVSGVTDPASRWCTFDSYFAASKRRGFYVAEMQTHIQAMFNPTTCVRPYELKQWCYEAAAGGAKGLIYWMWRPFTKGLQTAGRGLVDYKGRSTPRLDTAVDFGKEMRTIGALKPTRGRVGILFDGRCQDLQSYYTKCYKVDQNIYLNSISGAYDAFFEIGVRADIVKIEEIGEYTCILLTNHIMIGARESALLTDYVNRGGVLICDGKTGVVDEWSMLSGVLPGGALNALMGQEFEDSDYEQLDFECEGRNYGGAYGRDLMQVTDGEMLGRFADGYPAVVRKQSGCGEVISINTHLWYGYNQKQNDAHRFAAMLTERYNLQEITVSAPLRARLATDGTRRYAFVFNYGDEAVTGCLKGDGFDRTVSVAAHDVIVLKEEI